LERRVNVLVVVRNSGKKENKIGKCMCFLFKSHPNTM
jgi:hypothetical protein